MLRKRDKKQRLQQRHPQLLRLRQRESESKERKQLLPKLPPKPRN